jgi:hypothetical protein
MASVRLDFTPPDVPGITKLYIYESPTKAGAFSLIDQTTDVGSFPNYISYYSTDNAISGIDWFAIQWEDASGVQSDMSDPWQGGTTSLVQIISNRVMIRDPLASENIVVQEAEAVIEEVMMTDPYLVDPDTVSYKQKSGITLLTLARVMLTNLITQTNTSSYTAGLVSQSAGSSTQQTADISKVEKLIELANKDLGLNYSVILLMQKVCFDTPWTINEFTLEALGG